MPTREFRLALPNAHDDAAVEAASQAASLMFSDRLRLSLALQRASSAARRRGVTGNPGFGYLGQRNQFLEETRFLTAPLPNLPCPSRPPRMAA